MVLPSITLDYVNLVKDLVVIVDANLSFSTHYSAIPKKALQEAIMILGAFQTRNLELLVTALKIFFSRPLLPQSDLHTKLIKSIKLVERVQRKFTWHAFSDVFMTAPLHMK